MPATLREQVPLQRYTNLTDIPVLAPQTDNTNRFQNVYPTLNTLATVGVGLYGIKKLYDFKESIMPPSEKGFSGSLEDRLENYEGTAEDRAKTWLERTKKYEGVRTQPLQSTFREMETQTIRKGAGLGFDSSDEDVDWATEMDRLGRAARQPRSEFRAARPSPEVKQAEAEYQAPVEVVAEEPLKLRVELAGTYEPTELMQTVMRGQDPQRDIVKMRGDAPPPETQYEEMGY